MKALALIFAAACLLCAGAARAAQQPTARRPNLGVAGTVRDERGSPVADARVTLNDGTAAERRVVTNDDGRFAFDGPAADEGTITVEAHGFARRVSSWRLSDVQPAGIEIALAPASVAERVTVTATRTETRLGETAASVVVIDEESLATTAALTLDDALRQVPGFQLFRRTGGRAANPTAQGVSLRGVGASGASRAVVLADGVPLNDPFGGWVYWGRVPRASVAAVEVLRGGGSELFGSGALGGVVNVLTKRIEEGGALSLELSGGTQRTLDGSLHASARGDGWGAGLAAERFHTGGYFLVAPDERGPADTPAASRYSSLSLTVEREINSRLRLFARGNYFGEARDNGTQLQRNRTHVRQAVAGVDWQDERAGAFTLRTHFSSQVFDQSFSAVAADRQTETLTRNQRVPSQSAGLSAQWSRAFGASHVLVAGLDAREVRGASDEIIFASGRASSRVGAGGRERAVGLFVEDLIRFSPKLLVTAGARWARWRNYDALSASGPVSNPLPASVEVFPDRSESAFSPRASVLFSPNGAVSFHASAYRAFRAPTLNELYRDFRVGNVLTLANENLRAERLTGGEFGARLSLRESRINARATAFFLAVEGPVANVSLSETPSLVTRQRQNLGRTKSNGVEAEFDVRLAERLSLSGGYQFTSATVTSFPVNPALEGLRLPQVPRHSLALRVDYVAPSRHALSLQARASGDQFDDDLNRLRLAPFLALDAFASRHLNRRVELFAAAENLTGARYEVGRTPTVTLGPPRTVRFGLRLHIGRR